MKISLTYEELVANAELAARLQRVAGDRLPLGETVDPGQWSNRYTFTKLVEADDRLRALVTHIGDEEVFIEVPESFMVGYLELCYRRIGRFANIFRSLLGLKDTFLRLLGIAKEDIDSFSKEVDKLAEETLPKKTEG